MTGPADSDQTQPVGSEPGPAKAQISPARPARAARKRAALSRRSLILGSAFGALAIGGGVGTYAWYERPEQQPTPDPVGQQPMMGAMVGSPVDQQDVSRWQSDIATLVEYKQNLLRTGIYAWKLAPEKNQWDPAMATFYKNQFDHARSAGLDINLVVPGAPDWAQSLGWKDYLAACTWFWSHIRDTFGDQVALWQPFNEADHAHYQHFTEATRDATYLGELGELLGVAKETLGKDGVPVTTNLTGWPLNDEREQEWSLVLDAISEPLDVISIDLYPADNEDEIGRLAERMQRVKERYKKPIFVAEVGLQTTADSWTEPEQQRYVAAAIEQLRTIELWGICLYELRDTESQPGFGIKRADGSHKQGFDDVMQALGPR